MTITAKGPFIGNWCLVYLLREGDGYVAKICRSDGTRELLGWFDTKRIAFKTARIVCYERGWRIRGVDRSGRETLS